MNEPLQVPSATTGFRSTLATLSLVVLMQPHARGSAPSPEDLAQDSLRVAQTEQDQQSASPWREALLTAFTAEADAAARSEAARLFFLTTYKHRLADPRTAGASPSTDQARRDAKSFYKTWESLKAGCAKEGIAPLDLAEAVYKFTNSDWAPVSVAKGPGLDRVKTARQYRAWVTALLPVGRKAIQAKLEPREVWNRQAASYTVREPRDLEKAGLQPPQPRF